MDWHLLLHIRLNYIVMATKWAIIHIFARLVLEVIKKFFSWSSTISSPKSSTLWNFLKDVNRLASVTTQTLKAHCHSHQMSCHSHFYSSSLKSYQQMFFLKFDSFFTYSTVPWKILSKVQRLGSVITEILNWNCQGYQMGFHTHLKSSGSKSY